MKPKLTVCIMLLLVTIFTKGQVFYDFRTIATPGLEPYYNYIGPYPSWEMANSNSLGGNNRSIPYLDIEWKTSDISNLSIRILNSKGKTVRTMMAENVNPQRIFLDGLPNGRYMIMLTRDADQQVVRFVMQ